ncbi:M48 metallopeptidase family protein [Luteococcus sp. Sow4_B9]|uniref:M48 metallopeptidase family protein n=1 Tax=Luteococcus sp. Sow4_B9 TaxID=3438792 RepID=UPI003F9ABF5C
MIQPSCEQLVVDGFPVALRRSARRRKTVSARREGEGFVLLLPQGMSASDEQQWAERLVRRIVRRDRARRSTQQPDALLDRAVQLAQEHLDGPAGQLLRPASVRWVDNQNHRWGSCTPADGTIRLSSRLRDMPQWVRDYVLVHELAHLAEVHHTPRFHWLVGHYPQAERARGFLEGWTSARVTAAGDATIPEID